MSVLVFAHLIWRPCNRPLRLGHFRFQKECLLVMLVALRKISINVDIVPPPPVKLKVAKLDTHWSFVEIFDRKVTLRSG